MHDALIVRRSTKDDPVLLLLRKRYYAGVAKTHFTYSLACKVPQKNFDVTKGKVTAKGGFDRYIKYNRLFKSYKDHIDNFAMDFFIDHQRWPDRSELKNSMDVFIGRGENIGKTIYDLIETRVKEGLEDEDFSDESTKVYGNLRVNLKAFEKTGKVVEWNRMNVAWLGDFQRFLSNKTPDNEVTGVLAPSYVQKMMKTLKYFLNEGSRRDWHENRVYKKYIIRVKLHRKHGVKEKKRKQGFCVLSEDQMWSLLHFDFSKMKRGKIFSIYRDHVLRGCLTGCRFQDMNKVNKSNIVIHKGKEIYSYQNQKEGVESSIFVHPILSTVLNRYNGFPPPVPKASSSFSRVAKGMLIAANIQNAKYFSSHDMRRSCDTWLGALGFTENEIMDMVGWKSKGFVKRYNKSSLKENAVRYEEKFNKIKNDSTPK